MIHGYNEERFFCVINQMEPEVQVTSTKDNYLFETFSHLRASSANKIQLLQFKVVLSK